MNYTEKQLIAPALYLIDTCPGIKMDSLIKKMEKAMKPTGQGCHHPCWAWGYILLPKSEKLKIASG